jgi:predicted polyphosphate/ATP-dependent NAD kinase
MSNSHIPLEDMLDDLRITNKEIMEFEEENKVLSKNRERNRVQIYMNEGRILQRQKFVSQLEQLIEKTYPEHKINKL